MLLTERQSWSEPSSTVQLQERVGSYVAMCSHPCLLEAVMKVSNKGIEVGDPHISKS